MRTDRAGVAGRAGLGLLGAAFATASWNAVFFHGLQVTDWLLAVAGALLLLDALGRRSPIRGLPAGMTIGAVLLAGAGCWSVLVPTSLNYLNTRVVEVSPYAVYGRGRGESSDGSSLIKFEIALFVLPLLLCVAAATPRQVRRLLDVTLLGTTANALVAISDKVAHTGISTHLLGFHDITGRQSGLTQQPNHLGIAIVLAVPLAVAWMTQRKRSGIVIVAILLAGLYLTGSRGGLVAGAGAVPITMLAIRRTRSAGFWLSASGLVVIGAFANTLLSHTRFRSATGRASDLSRSQLRNQAWRDWLHSPWHGIGFSKLTEAHEVHLQLLAAGGVVALLGFAVYMTSVMRRAVAAARVEPIYGRALLVALFAWLALMFVENQLTVLYLYVPIAAVIALTPTGVRDVLRESGTGPKKKVSRSSPPWHAATAGS